ncbi:hypothetical protein [Undibacterium sp.]|uniref:hypothetical protein n=1 Tax=Undibacterium sp. TaxID=1914977 RepID=UPI002CB9760A|nr:hypothetical protein [Undibacterium sp.]HTD05697.1 hypothetical protein [Undibacterium sp.]
MSYDARLPWMQLFFALTALAADLASRYIAEPANMAIRNYYLKNAGQISQQGIITTCTEKL